MNVHFPSPAPRATDEALSAAVTQMAAAMQGLGSVDLDQPWAWGPHREGVRFALLGTYQELRELAVRLAAERRITLPVNSTREIGGNKSSFGCEGCCTRDGLPRRKISGIRLRCGVRLRWRCTSKSGIQVHW